LRVAPEMTAPVDAPAAATPLSSELRYKQAEARREVGVAEAIARERGVRRKDAGAASCWASGSVAPRERPPEGAPLADQSSHKCIHSVIQLYHIDVRGRNPGEGLIIGSYRFNLCLAILLDPTNC
jgi:hypothetical protein